MKCHQIKKKPTEIESWIFSTKFFFPKSSHGSSVDEASENAVKLDTKTQHVAQASGGVTPLESINWTRLESISVEMARTCQDDPFA